jgi:hypothetical protein
MENNKVVKGTIKYISIGAGVWVIEDENGQKWELTNLSNEYKEDGVSIKIELEEIENAFSVFMVGKPAKILKYS